MLAHMSSVVSPRFLAKSHAKNGDRRRTKRTPLDTEAWIASPTAINAADRTAVTAVNLSRHGLAFRSSVALPIDSYFRLHLAGRSGHSNNEIRIVRCDKSDDGYDVGSEFA